MDFPLLSSKARRLIDARTRVADNSPDFLNLTRPIKNPQS